MNPYSYYWIRPGKIQNNNFPKFPLDFFENKKIPPPPRKNLKKWKISPEKARGKPFCKAEYPPNSKLGIDFGFFLVPLLFTGK